MADQEISDVRAARHAISKACGHDVRKTADYYRAVEKELKRAGTFRVEARTPSIQKKKKRQTLQPLSSHQ